MLGVRLPQDLERRLSMLVAKTHRPKSYFVKEALVGYLNAYEGVYEAVAEYEADKKKGILKTYSFEEVMQENGLNDDDLDT